MTKSTMERQVELRLLDHDLRLTKGRQAVIDTLSNASGPMSAAELGAVLGARVPLSSLYRTLAVLEESGVVSHHLGAKGLTRYELAEWLTGHHHHLVCVDCGSVADVDIPASEEQRVRDLIADIAAQAHFLPTDHALEIEGHCSRCA